MKKFDYFARVEILDWVFEVRCDGSLMISTAYFTPPKPGEINAIMILNEGNKELLRALLALPTSISVEHSFDGCHVENVGWVP